MTRTPQARPVRRALALLLLGLSAGAMAGEFDGRWALKDTKGTPFEISLGTDGKAEGTHNDSMKHGTWKEEGGAAVIHWDTGWTTRIARGAQGYVKTAFKPGAALDGKPANSSEAVKLK